MKKQSHSAFQSPALRRAVATALLCCSVQAGPAWAQGGNDVAALNFVGADIESVIKAVGHYTGMTFIVDPRVKGSLTLVTEKSVSKAQAFSMLTSQLRLQGFAVVVGDGFAKVVPEAEAKLQSSPTLVGLGAPSVKGDQVATQIFHLAYESATNLTAVLRPLISPNNSITANTGNNSLVITDYADNLKRLTKIIAALDAPVAADIDVIPVRYAIASDLASMVEKLLAPTAGGDSGRILVQADPRSNSIVLRAPTQARANLAKALITKLDQPTSQAGNVHVVYLKNADATKLAATLRAVISSDSSPLPQNQSGTSGGTVSSIGSQGSGANQQQQQQQLQQASNAGTSSQQSSQQGGSGAGFIQADASTNTLIITANETLYRNLRAIIDQLDARRAQVYIESLIVEVSSDKASEFGIQWVGLSGNDASKYRVGGVTSFSSGSNNLVNLAAAAASAGTATAKAFTPGAGFTIGLFKQINGQLGLGALAHALETEGNANILSTPTMFTLDNELATMKVGQNVPIISGQFTTSGGGTNANPFQTIDRRDVGLTLKVRPQISEGGTIKMAIYHETSSVDPSSLGSAAGVTLNNRVIESNVLADDGEIFVLGGLIEDTEGDGIEKVRGLGDIPVLGNLFKYQTRKRKKTNLMIFLRPVIVRSQEHSASLAASRYDYMRATGDTAQPKDDTLMLNNLGAPVLPKLVNGQPQANGTMAPVAPKPATAPVAVPPVPVK
jgi:general secretion pathway protein D